MFYDKILYAQWCMGSKSNEYVELLREFEPLASKGFMFSPDQELNIIEKMMDSSEASVQVGHSGASFALTMRNLKFIANNGLDAYKELYLKNKENQDEQTLENS